MTGENIYLCRFAWCARHINRQRPRGAAELKHMFTRKMRVEVIPDPLGQHVCAWTAEHVQVMHVQTLFKKYRRGSYGAAIARHSGSVGAAHLARLRWR